MRPWRKNNVRDMPDAMNIIFQPVFKKGQHKAKPQNFIIVIIIACLQMWKEQCGHAAQD